MGRSSFTREADAHKDLVNHMARMRGRLLGQDIARVMGVSDATFSRRFSSPETMTIAELRLYLKAVRACQEDKDKLAKLIIKG